MDWQQTSTYQSGTEHIDNLINEYTFVEQEQIIEKRATGLMDKEGFKTLFFGAGNVLYIMKHYETLKRLDPSEPQAVDAIEALYDSIIDIPQLHWMLCPGNKWAQRSFAIGVFFIPFAFGIRKDILNEKKLKIENNKKNKPFIAEKQSDIIDLSGFENNKAENVA